MISFTIIYCSVEPIIDYLFFYYRGLKPYYEKGGHSYFSSEAKKMKTPRFIQRSFHLRNNTIYVALFLRHIAAYIMFFRIFALWIINILFSLFGGQLDSAYMWVIYGVTLVPMFLLSIPGFVELVKADREAKKARNVQKNLNKKKKDL